MAQSQAPGAAAATAPFTLAQLLFLAMNVAAVLAAGGQVLIEQGALNLGCTSLVALSVVATMQYLERSGAFEDTPISSLAVLGLCVTTQWASLTAQSLAGTPLVDGLKTPLVTFAVLCAVQGIALGSHWIYRRFQPLQAVRRGVSDMVVAPLGLYRTPSPAAVWVLSLIGAASIAAGGAEMGDAGGKLFQALGLFAWLPAMIPILYARYGSAYCRIGTQVPMLVGYALLLVAIGLARNGRSLMLVGPIQLALVLLIYGLRDHRAATSKMVAWLAAGAVGAGIVTFGARDLATAMVVVRDQKEMLSPIDMLGETIAALGDRSKLELFRDTERGMSRFEAYDEIYLDNPLIARFSETKFHDNMFSILEQLKDDERASIAEVTWIKTLTLLPQPVLDRLGFELDKERFEFSMGDYYRSLTESTDYLGGYAIGSLWADLIAIFDWWAPLVVVVIFIGVFVALDILSRTDRDGSLLLSPLAVCIAWSVFLYGLSADSLAARIGFFVRDQPQRLLLYAAAATLLHWILPWRPATAEASALEPSDPLTLKPASKGGSTR